MFILLFLLSAVRCEGQLKPISDVLEGFWNVSEIKITSEGLENPDVANYSFKISKSEVNFTYFTEVSRVFNNGVEFPNHTLKIKFSTDYSNFTLTLDDEIEVQNKLTVSIDLVRRCVGALYNPDISYSFIFLSSYRAELSVFDRIQNDVTVFRFWKKFEADRVSGLAKYGSYLFRKSIFRAI